MFLADYLYRLWQPIPKTSCFRYQRARFPTYGYQDIPYSKNALEIPSKNNPKQYLHRYRDNDKIQYYPGLENLYEFPTMDFETTSPHKTFTYPTREPSAISDQNRG